MVANALLKTLRCLESFQTSSGVLTQSEIVGLTGDSASSVQRSLYTLEVLGYLERDAGGPQYAPGRACLKPAYGFMRSCQLLKTAMPHLIELRDRFDLRADLSTLEGTDIIYLGRIPSRDELLNLSPLGKRWPAANTASGRTMLAALPQQTCENIIATTQFKAFTPHTILDLSVIETLIKDAQRNGYAHQHKEVLLGSSSVAAAVTGAGGNVLGAITLGGTFERFSDPDELQRLGVAALKAAQAISAHNL